MDNDKQHEDRAALLQSVSEASSGEVRASDMARRETMECRRKKELDLSSGSEGGQAHLDITVTFIGTDGKVIPQGKDGRLLPQNEQGE